MRLSSPVGLVVVFALLGCGSSTGLPVDAAAEAGDAMSDAGYGDGASLDVATETTFRWCTPGADQTCNDDPRVSSLWGACGDDGSCTCKDGTSVNPATGRCRLGNLCVAAAADNWPFRMPLDTAGCAGRAATACLHTTLDAAALNAAMPAGCHFPAYLLIRVELEHGCPAVLEGRSLLSGGLSSFDAQFLSCLTTILSTTRFSCAAETDCAMEEYDTLP